ncbi:MAG: PHP domain-containing protein [Ruminococcaceae bacterium]|nr:PHP domain-containing protein [Oscillospiraceae bacterium]
MRKYLFNPNYNFYKANMHCHTVLSDGKRTPEEIKADYMQKGYQIVAYTDHRVVIPHNDLAEENFLPITASEFDCNEPDVVWPATRTYHLNFYAKDKNKSEFIPFTRVHSVEGINKVIADAKAAGFLAQYNHPRWNSHKPKDFLGLLGLDSFEMYNHGCEIGETFDGEADYEYELFVRTGKHCAVTASDDNHRECEQFGGFTMFSAPALEYDAIINALEKGDCYASTGPVINELYVEDGVLHIECSPVYKVCVFSDSRNYDCKLNTTREDGIVSADLKVDFPHKYLRVIIEDVHGKRAWTRAYFEV